MSPVLSWLERVLAGAPDHEREVVDRYTTSLVELARRELPGRIRRRVDPEDIVQSVYRSFFRRLEAGEFGFEESHDVWRLLAVMTYHKVANVAKHHRRQRRDASREVTLPAVEDGSKLGLASTEPQPEDLVVMVEFLDHLLSELPAEYHRIVTLRLEGHSIAEIADHVKLSQRTILRVLAKLRDLASRQLEDGG